MLYHRKPQIVDALRRPDGSYLVQIGEALVEMSKDDFERDYQLPTAEREPREVRGEDAAPLGTAEVLAELRSLASTIRTLGSVAPGKPAPESLARITAEDNQTHTGICATCGEDTPTATMDAWKNCPGCQEKELAGSENINSIPRNTARRGIAYCENCSTPFDASEVEKGLCHDCRRLVAEA